MAGFVSVNRTGVLLKIGFPSSTGEVKASLTVFSAFDIVPRLTGRLKKSVKTRWVDRLLHR